VVLYETNDVMFLGCCDEVIMMRKELCGWFGDKDVNTPLDRVEGNGIMGRIRSEDDDSIPGGQPVDGSLVSLGVDSTLFGEFVKVRSMSL